MGRMITRTAEHVCDGHPDKLCDQIADRVLDEAYRLAGIVPVEGKSPAAVRRELRTAIEVLAKGDLVVVSGEVRLPAEILSHLNIVGLARSVYQDVGYPDDRQPAGSDGHRPVFQPAIVTNAVYEQAAEIAGLVDTSVSDSGTVGAGDQGIMVGYATSETPEMMPLEWVLARNICKTLGDLRRSRTLPWIRPDGKSQVTLDDQGRATSVIVAVQHDPTVERGQIESEIRTHVLEPVLEDRLGKARVVINGGGSGTFVEGGPIADAGTVGRKIVVDAYGPRVPVGGGAYSGKDPSKVDRSAAYMARHIAKTIVHHKIRGARECTVSLAFAIGQFQPEMVTAVTDTGEDLSGWVREKFPDLSPGGIIERLRLTDPEGWSYFGTASYGHYGTGGRPWEEVAEVE